LRRADPGQWRDGLAVLSRETARNAVQPAVGGRFNSRPMMGVQFGNRVAGLQGALLVPSRRDSPFRVRVCCTVLR